MSRSPNWEGSRANNMMPCVRYILCDNQFHINFFYFCLILLARQDISKPKLDLIIGILSLRYWNFWFEVLIAHPIKSYPSNNNILSYIWAPWGSTRSDSLSRLQRYLWSSFIFRGWSTFTDSILLNLHEAYAYFVRRSLYGLRSAYLALHKVLFLFLCSLDKPVVLMWHEVDS